MGVAYKNLAVSCHEVRFFFRRLRADLDLIVNEFKQIGSIVFLITNATHVVLSRERFIAAIQFNGNKES